MAALSDMLALVDCELREGGRTPDALKAAFSCFCRIRSSYFALPDSSDLSGWIRELDGFGVGWLSRGDTAALGFGLLSFLLVEASLPISTFTIGLTLAPTLSATTASFPTVLSFFRLFFVFCFSDLALSFSLLLPSICFFHNSAKFSLVI